MFGYRTWFHRKSLKKQEDNAKKETGYLYIMHARVIFVQQTLPEYYGDMLSRFVSTVSIN